MPYGTDVSVYVEDIAGDQGAPSTGQLWWLSPDVDIPAHSGEAVQGTNQVQIRVHARDEPVLDEKIVAEVYVGNPSLVMSPTAGTRRIDPGNLLFRPANVAGTEPVANVPGATLTFDWIPSADADIDGPGHRCLVVRAFPQSLTPPSDPFDVPGEQHEAQHNIEILTTTSTGGATQVAGAGTHDDPRKRDERTGLWWELLATLTPHGGRRSIVAVAFDAAPQEHLPKGTLRALERAKVRFSTQPPARVVVAPAAARGTQVERTRVLESDFGRRSELGEGIFAKEHVLAAATVELRPRRTGAVLLGFDHSNLDSGTAAVLHVAQWSERGEREGGTTVVALTPTKPRRT